MVMSVRHRMMPLIVGAVLVSAISVVPRVVQAQSPGDIVVIRRLTGPVGSVSDLLEPVTPAQPCS